MLFFICLVLSVGIAVYLLIQHYRSTFLPSRYDTILGLKQLPIQYQSTCGSCWAHSTSTALQARLWFQTHHTDDITDVGDLLANTPGNNGCRGGTIKNAYSFCQQAGLLGSNGRRRLRTFRNLAGSRISDIKHELLSHGPVTAHVIEYPSMKKLGRHQTWKPLPDEPMVGGHAVVIYGWDDERGGWLIQNSWGDAWCDAGRGVFGYTAGNIESLHVYAGYF